MSAAFFEALVVPGGLPLLFGPAVFHGLSIWVRSCSRLAKSLGRSLGLVRGLLFGGQSSPESGLGGCCTLILLLPFASCVASSPGTRKGAFLHKGCTAALICPPLRNSHLFGAL